MARFTKEDAKAMSILDVAQSLGMEMEQNSSQEWYWVEHDSFKINTRKNRFNWYSRDIHGDVINLVETIKEVDYKQAMHYLRTGEFPKIELNQQPKEPFRYVLGRFEQPFIEARDYLKEVRGLSDDTINFFGQAGVLAQANKKVADDYLEPVVVFKSLDKQGNIIRASLQGIVPNRERHEGKGYLKQTAYNSDGLSGMSVDIGTPKRLVFAEAPIDLMSYYEANKGNLSDVRLVAMDGLKPGTVSRYTLELLAELQGKSDYKPDLNKVGEALEKLAKVTTFFQDGKNSDLITLAVDNDKAGRDFIERLQAKGIPVQSDLPPLPEGATKMDWNDYLKSQKAGMVLEDSLPRDNSRLETVPVNIQSSEKIQELLEQVEELGQTAYFWVTEEDLEQPKEIVSQLDNWFSSGKVDSTYKSDLFELVAGDYTYMIEFRDGSISLQNMEDYSQYISNRIEEFGVGVVISELESVIHDFNQVKNSITEGMNKELDALTSVLTRDTELLDKQTTINNEKEQDMELAHESETPTLKALYSSEIFSDKPQVVEYLKEWSADATEVSQIMESLSKLDPNRSDWLTPVQYHLDEMRREQQRKNIEQDKLEYGSESAELYHSREFQDKPIVVQWLKDNNATENELRELLPLIRELNIEGWLNPEWKTLVQERLVGLRSPYMVRFNWSENLGGSPNPLKDFSEGDLIPYAEFISVLYRRNEYSSDRGYERTSFDIISPDGEVIVSDFRYDTGSEVRTIAEKLEDSELAKIEEANKEPYKLFAAIDKHLEIPANISLPEAAIDAISTQYGENSPVLPEAEEKMLDWLEQRYPPTSEYFLELHRGFGVAGLKSTLTYDIWEQYIAESSLSETELREEVEQRTERLLQVRTEIKERLQSEFVPALLKEMQKAPEQTQGQEKNAESTIEDLPKLNIWSSTNENAILSNLAVSPIWIRNFRFESVEHAYQTLKSNGFTSEALTWAESNRQAFKQGRKIQSAYQLGPTNKLTSITLMEKLLTERFLQDAEFREALIQTKGFTLTHKQDNGIWKKEFPRILMDLRDGKLVNQKDHMEKEKAPEQAQEHLIDRTSIGTDSLQLEAEGSVKPVSNDTFEQTVTSHPTSSYPLLHFSTNFSEIQRRIGNYHPITEADIKRLNQYAPSIQNTAQWYSNELAGSFVYFVYASQGQQEVLSVNFRKENFVHLTGIRPFEEGKGAADFLDDFVSGRGRYDSILVSNSLKHKLQALPMLSDILDPKSFILDNLTSVEKLHKLDMSEALKSKDEDFLLLFKDAGEERIPASLMKIKGDLKTKVAAVDEKVILGIYRERSGIIDQLSINKEYVKDGGKEFLTILQNRQLEPLIAQKQNSTVYKTRWDGVTFSTFDEYKTYVLDKLELERSELGEEEYGLIKRGLNQASTPKLFIEESMHSFISVGYINDFEIRTVSDLEALNDDGTLNMNIVERILENREDELNRAIKHDRALEAYEEGLIELNEARGIAEMERQIEIEQRDKLNELLTNDDQAGLAQHLKEGMKEYANSDKYKQFLQAISKFHDYSIYNVHMMLLQKPDITLVASYRKWKSDFDRQVQKGEKGIKIWVPMTFKEKDKNGQPVLDANGQEKTVTRFKLGTVFDVSQTAGKELPQPVYNLESDVPDYQNIYRAARHVSQENGVKISFRPIDSGANGYYHIEKNEIVIADKKMSEAQILKTLFHEMAHSELHHHNDGYSRSERELQAESIAYVVANHYGIDTSDYSFAYLHNWSQDKQGYEDLESQLKVVQAESKSLINRIDKSLELVKNKTLTTNKLQSKIAQAKQKQEQQKQLRSSEVSQEKSKKKHPTPKEL